MNDLFNALHQEELDKADRECRLPECQHDPRDMAPCDWCSNAAKNREARMRRASLGVLDGAVTKSAANGKPSYHWDQYCHKCFNATPPSLVILRVCSDGPFDDRQRECSRHLGEGLGLVGNMKL